MRKDKSLRLIYLLAVISSSLAVIEGIGEGYIIGHQGEEVTFNIKITQTSDSIDLAKLYHPSKNVLFLIKRNQDGNLELNQPSESVFQTRVVDYGYSSDILTFRLKSLETGDAGVYTCNSLTCSQKLIVVDKPRKPVVTNLTPIIAYTEVELNCSTASASLPPDHGLKMTYIWRQNGQVLSESSNTSVIFLVDRDNDGDRFTCQAYELNNLKSDVSEPMVFNPDFGPEQIKITPASTIKLGIEESVTVGCTVDCKPTCQISWKRNGQLLSSSNLLMFNNITRPDDGVYTCHAENTHGTSDKDLTIDVLYAPIIISQRFEDSSSSTDIDIGENSDVNITLDIDSNPKPYVDWNQNGNQIKTNNTTMVTEGPVIKVQGVKKQVYTSIYKIKQAQCDDMANYTAMVSNNRGGITSSTFALKVLCKPRIDSKEYFKKEFAPEVGDSVDIKMRVVAYPNPVIKTIYHNGSVLPASSFTLSQRSELDYLTVFTLTKSDISLSDLGYYYLELSNRPDYSVNITVHFKEKGKPSTPIDLEALDVGALKLTLQWTSTFNGGDKQTFCVWYKHLYGNWTFYNHTYRDPGEGYSVKAEIKGLRDLTAYLFRVSSKNRFGMSDYTEPISVTTTEYITSIQSAGIAGDIGMWVGISLGLVAVIVIVIVVSIIFRKKYLDRKKANFFRDLREAGAPMMPGQQNFTDLANKENHHYEEIQECRSRASSPGNGSNGTAGTADYVSTIPPPKPPRTYVEPVEKKPDPIWKPSERKSSKVNENTIHLHEARMSLKPVVNKGQL